jgi:hypothetical protein
MQAIRRIVLVVASAGGWLALATPARADAGGGAGADVPLAALLVALFAISWWAARGRGANS